MFVQWVPASALHSRTTHAPAVFEAQGSTILKMLRIILMLDSKGIPAAWQ